MIDWNKTPFAELLVDSKDGEWGDGEETVGSRESIIIRGTDFAGLDNPAAEFPRRWIKNHIADRKRLQPGDLILETAGGTSTQSTGRSALLKKSFLIFTQMFQSCVRVSAGICVWTRPSIRPGSSTICFRRSIALVTWRSSTSSTPVFQGFSTQPS